MRFSEASAIATGEVASGCYCCGFSDRQDESFSPFTSLDTGKSRW